MTKQQSIEALANRFFNHDDQNIHVEGEISDAHLHLDNHDYYIGVGELAEPLVSPTPHDFDEVYGRITYDDNPTFISTHDTGAHIAYQIAPTFEDDLVQDDTMIDQTQSAPLLTEHQVTNALAGLKPMRARDVLENTLTKISVGGDARTPPTKRPCMFTATYTGLVTPIQNKGVYKAATNAVTQPHGERPRPQPNPR